MTLVKAIKSGKFHSEANMRIINHYVTLFPHDAAENKGLIKDLVEVSNFSKTKKYPLIYDLLS
jgi:hypothetical protein